MSIIKKKIRPEYFEAVEFCKKNFELQLNDFEVNEGDTLVLEEWDPETKDYTGRKVERIVTYVAKFRLGELFWPKEEIEEKGFKSFRWNSQESGGMERRFASSFLLV